MPRVIGCLHSFFDQYDLVAAQVRANGSFTSLIFDNWIVLEYPSIIFSFTNIARVSGHVHHLSLQYLVWHMVKSDPYRIGGQWTALYDMSSI